jgi:HPr kinase/phosphorylase
VLIRGPSGAGKSRLALALIEAARVGRLPFASLVGDDRVHLSPTGGRLLVRPAAALAGLIEMRGDRLPAAEQRHTVIEGIMLPRLAVAAGEDALPPLIALITCLPKADGLPHNTVLGT